MALKQLDEEALTVTNASKAFTEAKVTVDSDGHTIDVKMASCQHIAGGAIYMSSSGAVISDTGANGELKRSISDTWEVWGFDDLKKFRMKIKNGESDATIQVAYFGAS